MSVVIEDPVTVTVELDGVELIDAYAAARPVLGGSAAYQRQGVRAARRFLAEHPNLSVWMRRALADRLTQLAAPEVWPLVAFALVTGRVRADAELLLAKNFGHSMRRWVLGLFPRESERLLAAADRIGVSETQASAFLAEGLAFVIAFTGVSPGQLTGDDLDRCVAAVKTSTVGTAAMKRSRTATLFGARKLLFEAGLIDCPPVQRRQGGPATRRARLAVIAAPAIRDTLLAYLDARAAVLRPKTIDKLTSALGVFGEFLTATFPEVTAIEQLERRHI
jgi:hypothetical protein